MQFFKNRDTELDKMLLIKQKRNNLTLKYIRNGLQKEF